MVFILLILISTLVFIKIDTASSSTEFNNQLTVLSSTNTLIPTIYQLFYQYYQYYQIQNYP
jgi:hypothetical protein